ncbi:MAG: DUF3887 domain-containing protein [Bacillota bacterium]|nr:DUF3887 domain-containing protein [Bacillota bacterium]
MKKFLLVSLLVLGLVLTACSNGQASEEMEAAEEEKYVTMSKENIQLINEQGFEALEDLYSQEMKEAMAASSMEETNRIIVDKGAFKEFGQGGAVYFTDESTSNKYIVSQVETIYENGKLIFTINYNLDDQIIGLFMK